MRHREMLRGWALGAALWGAWAACEPAPARAGGLSVIDDFNSINGENPYDGPTFDSAGDMFGTSYRGGTYGDGTVWEIASGSSTINALASFSINSDIGGFLAAGVTLDAQGNLYGTTVEGLTNGGSVWELPKGSSTPILLANVLEGTENPVTIDSHGNIFGTINSAGPQGDGLIWELKAGSSAITILAYFSSATSGSLPIGRMLIDSSGNLYGMTNTGGVNGGGTVWELQAGSSTITPLASFTRSTTGAQPQGNLAMDANGNLYGTAHVGGTYNDGTVWELVKGSGTITALASFNDTNGMYPASGVTIDSQGNLFGTATQGGTTGAGTVWEIAAGTTNLTAIASFNDIQDKQGSDPIGSVTIGPQGTLYGTTYSGGLYGDGVVWQLPGFAAPPLVSVPEPSSLVLGVIGLASAIGAARMKSRRRS